MIYFYQLSIGELKDNMREIELKYKVKNYDELINKLEKMNCKIENAISQNDTIYVKNLENTDSVEGSIWLRVRKNNDKIELNLKKQSKNIRESEEIEFGVDSYIKANQFLEILGYKKWVEVNKKRRYSKYKNYNLCIDEVEKLGSFIEIELLVEETDQNDYIDALKNIAKELGLEENDTVNTHYDTMISELDKQ